MKTYLITIYERSYTLPLPLSRRLGTQHCPLQKDHFVGG